MEKITLSFAPLAAIIAMTILQACAGTAGTPVREANAGSLRRNPCDDASQGHDNDGDRRGLFALHARRFDTDWRTVG